MLRALGLALACATLTACTHDFGAFDGPACSEPGGRTFGGHCYFGVVADTWDAAKAKCAGSHGAHLVAIGSAAEQTFVRGFGHGQRWIGLRRAAGAPATKSSYTWITGEPATYDGWGTGEPAGNGECVDLTDAATWEDQDCARAWVGMCERE